jgi:hypothetical protein
MARLTGWSAPWRYRADDSPEQYDHYVTDHDPCPWCGRLRKAAAGVGALCTCLTVLSAPVSPGRLYLAHAVGGGAASITTADFPHDETGGGWVRSPFVPEIAVTGSAGTFRPPSPEPGGFA